MTSDEGHTLLSVRGEAHRTVAQYGGVAAHALSRMADDGGISVDPVPQMVSATIDARLTAVVGPLPER